MSRQPASTAGWLATIPTLRPGEAGEADHEVGREVLVHLQEAPVVHHRQQELLDVVGLRGVGGTRVSRSSSSRSVGSLRLRTRRLLQVVRGQVGEQLADQEEAGAVVVHREVGDAGAGVVGHGPAELLLGHLLVGDRLDDVGPGHEHVGGVLHHHVEVGDGRAVDRAPGAGPQDRGDLRHHSGGEGVAQEDVRVAAEGGHSLLDARAPGVVEADHRGAHLHREVHDLADLLGVGLGEAAAEDREVLGEDGRRAARRCARSRRRRRRRAPSARPCRSRGSGARPACRAPRRCPRRAASPRARGR